MTRLFLSLFCIVTFASSAFAQSEVAWTKPLGHSCGEGCTAITRDDGNSLIVSTLEFLLGYTVRVTRLDADGRFLGNTTPIDSDTTVAAAHDIVATDSGDFIIVGGIGSRYSRDRTQPFIAKLDPQGELLWRKSFDAEGRFGAIDRMADGFVLLGSRRQSDGRSRFTVVTTDDEGNIIWEVPSDLFEGAGLREVIATSDGGIVVAGQIGQGLVIALYVAKLDAMGALLWKQTFAPLDAMSVGGMAPTLDGGVVVASNAGSRTSSVQLLYTVRLDAAGNTLWDVLAEGENRRFISEVVATDEDTFLLAGRVFGGGAQGDDFYLAELDAGGNLKWEEFIGDENGEGAFHVTETEDGEYVVVGSKLYFDEGVAVGSSLYAFQLNRPTEGTNVESPPGSTSGVHSLSSYPNPTTSSTTIAFGLDRSQHVRIELFDSTGRRVAVLADQPFSAGGHEVSFSSARVANGVYFYRLQSEDENRTGRLIVAR